MLHLLQVIVPWRLETSGVEGNSQFDRQMCRVIACKMKQFFLCFRIGSLQIPRVHFVEQVNLNTLAVLGKMPGSESDSAVVY